MTEKNPHAQALGRMGGLIGGPARAKALHPVIRRKIALTANKASWTPEARAKRKANGRSRNKPKESA